ncbi:sensor histidine kinase [Mucilaginibacter myungsuensis]|uniref:Histidine kinase n=1 Tax=Mucilaginibacter myungsuensis TaxID=649104 RepID=A0A929PXD6_9SPHI|nr:histidine kinase [Mucilaginibacter myungsuensis]MBE9663066.1 histidine kinase [Mucilaginibacter myungsuensis]MDN3598700.1 histidine kinase [Mucilaginibacter myungsuensis]
MVRVLTTFFRVNSRKLLLLTVFSLFIYGSFFMLSYLVTPERTLKNFAGENGLAFGIASFVVESVITHYVLIFLVILPTMHGQRSRHGAILITVLAFFVKFVIDYGTYLLDSDIRTNGSNRLSEHSIGWVLFISYLFTMVSSLSVAMLVEWVNKSKERIILQKQRTEAELSALKHQINPHFLFNSLSFIYGKVIKTDRETADSVLMLANIMRYALGSSESLDGKVNIMDELEHLKNVIEINQRRHDHQLNIRYEEQIDDQSISILPLVLITLVENAFKHGDLHDPEHPLLIRVNTSVNELTFEIGNKKGKGIKELSNGVGLQNIRQQLKLTYGERCSFVITDTGLTFSVTLHIKFQV